MEDYLTCCDIMNYNINEVHNRECGYDYDTRERCGGCPHYIEIEVKNYYI